MSAEQVARVQRAPEVEPWPRGVSREAELSIGQVTKALEAEFPAIKVSKIRFLEDQGLISPVRSGSGYRKYSPADVERLRYVLTRQRDSYAPLKVIGDELRAMDAGHEVTVAAQARIVASDGQVVRASGEHIPARELSDLTGVDVEVLERYATLGLITPDMGGYFPARSVQVVNLLASLEASGIEARLLRAVRSAAERHADLVDMVVDSQRARGRAGDLERAAARSAELGEMVADLHREMMRVAVARLNA